jgi:hypothetical protein
VVVPPGHYSTGGDEATRSDIELAPVGHYAINGILRKCPGGTYGDATVRGRTWRCLRVCVRCVCVAVLT